MASKVARREKELIAAAAADTLQDGQSIILDSGTTAMELAELIRKKKLHLTVVTNDLLVAGLFSNSPDIKLLVPGGTLRPGSYTLLGEPGLSFIRGLHVDTAYMGIQAIKDDCLSDTSTDVCIMKRQMAAAAARTIVLADSSKFGKTAFRDAFEIGDVDQIITNRDLPESRSDYYTGKGVKIVLA
jgi:DeoR/GlpR family transcriptional regulator of sugar metabolism